MLKKKFKQLRNLVGKGYKKTRYGIKKSYLDITESPPTFQNPDVKSLFKGEFKMQKPMKKGRKKYGLKSKINVI